MIPEGSSSGVHDAGAGFSIQDAMPPSESEGGFGLSNARERLHFIGGRLEIDSETGTGTQVVVRVPVGAV